jgi:HEAT repeat protein
MAVGLVAQEPAGPTPVSPAELDAAIGRLGDLDYDTRTTASRLVRRTAAAQAVPALRRAVAEHKDGYVRFRALVLLTGFNDPQTAALMKQAQYSPNDRLRTVAYAYFEHHPDPNMLPDLLVALETELAEFVRPALVRALAAQGTDPRVQAALTREAARGEDFFRSAVIEALGDYRAAYAVDALLAVVALEGPLQDDAALALGKIGDQRALPVLASLQRSAPRTVQPAIAAAICLLGVNCETHETFIADTLTFADSNQGFVDLLRSSTASLGALGMTGRDSALRTLLDVGVPSNDPTRARAALAVGAIALRNPPLLTSVLQGRPDVKDAVLLLAEGFDMLEEDFEQERFFAHARRSYWEAAEGSPERVLLQTLITTLEF